MTTADVIVLGAGMGGLVTARALARAGLRVLVLEARDRSGGRVRTLQVPGWPLPIELGAEFVHGSAEALVSLVEESGGRLVPDEAPHFVKSERGFEPNDAVWQAMAELFGPERQRGVDRSAKDVIDGARPDPHVARMMALFIEGFHASEVGRISARSVALQMTGGDEKQHRLADGYGQLAAAIEADVLRHQGIVRYGVPARRVEWEPGRVTVVGEQERHRANSLVVALPLGLLKAGTVPFQPELPAARASMAQLEMGHAFRAVIRLERPLWLERGLHAAVFLHAPELEVPTFWTATSEGAAQLTAWCGGSRATRLLGRCADDRALQHAVLQAAADVLDLPLEGFQRCVLGVHAHAFSTDPRSGGAYPYALTGADLGGAFEPVNETIFFVGDYTDPQELGTVGSTVERALSVAECVRVRLGRAG